MGLFKNLQDAAHSGDKEAIKALVRYYESIGDFRKATYWKKKSNKQKVGKNWVW